MTHSSVLLAVAAAAAALALACGAAQQGAPGATSSAGAVSGSAAAPPVATASAAPATSTPSASNGTSTPPAATITTGPASASGAGEPIGTPSGDTPGVDVGTVQVTGGSLPNVDDVVAALRPSFASCVARGREQRADVQGRVAVTIRVGTAGQVLGVAAQQSTEIPASVASCITTRAATAQFEPPKGTKTQSRS